MISGNDGKQRQIQKGEILLYSGCIVGKVIGNLGTKVKILVMQK